MAEHTAKVIWRRDADAPFLGNRYSREHLWRFDGGTEVPASSSPYILPVPLSTEEAVDPEEAFVASLSSCHMLWFLTLAARKRYVVDEYEDDAVGHVEKNPDGKMAVTRVVLRPRVAFGGDRKPDAAALDALHHAAHAECFIANSVRSEVTCEPQP